MRLLQAATERLSHNTAVLGDFPVADTYQHRGCRIVVVHGVAANGAAFLQYEITPESAEAKAAFKRHGVDLITGSKIPDLALSAGRREIDLLFDGRG
jgi:hypothetical protein